MLDKRWLEAALQTYPLGPWLGLWRAMELALLSEAEMLPPVLDLGCSNGLFSYKLFEKIDDNKFDAYTYYRLGYVPSTASSNTHILIGLDVDRASVTRARNLGLYRGLVVADAHQMPFCTGFFSTVLSNCVLEHIEGLDQVLAQVSRLLRNGGKLVFTVPSVSFGENLLVTRALCRMGWTSLARRYIAARNKKLGHFNLWKMEEWCLKLERLGLRVVAHQYYLPPRSERLWDFLYMVQFFPIVRYGMPILERIYVRALSIFPNLIMIKRAWVRFLGNWLSAYFQVDTVGGGLLIIAEKLVDGIKE